jgi:hypothetical protein
MRLAIALPLLAGGDRKRLVPGVSLSRHELLLFIPFALGGSLLHPGLMAGVGALAPQNEDTRAWVLLITLPLMARLHFCPATVSGPDGRCRSG